MAQRIIDIFESVQIEKEHGNLGVSTARSSNRLAETILEPLLAMRGTGESGGEGGLP